MRPAPDVVSVVVPVGNISPELHGQLAALSAQDYDGAWEVVIADNRPSASQASDETTAIVDEWQDRLPGLRVVDASRRRGSSPARNDGVAASGGALIAFCESDDQVSPTWVTGLVAAARHYDMIGGGIDFRRLNDDQTIAWRGFDASPLTALPVTRHFLPIAVGANCAIWRPVLEQVGGWNEEYRSQTDVELSWRVQLAAFQLGFAPDALVHYKLRDSTRALAIQSYQHGKSSALLYRDFRAHGMPRAVHRFTARRGSSGPARPVSELNDRRARRGQFVRQVSTHAGRLVGSLRYRTLYL